VHGLRETIALSLLWPAVRTMRWVPLGVIAALGAWVVRSGAREQGDPAATALPVATIMLGVWLCLLFEDAAADITGPSPVPLWRRRAVKVAVAVPVFAASWFALTWVGPLHGPTWAMTGMAVGVGAVAVAAASVTTRVVVSARSGPVAAVVLVGVIVAMPVVIAIALGRPATIDPDRVPVGDPRSYWTSVIVLALVVSLPANRDPALRSSFRLSRRRTSSTPVRPLAAGEPR
jgi:hypothetical protein